MAAAEERLATASAPIASGSQNNSRNIKNPSVASEKTAISSEEMRKKSEKS